MWTGRKREGWSEDRRQSLEILLIFLLVPLIHPPGRLFTSARLFSELFFKNLIFVSGVWKSGLFHDSCTTWGINFHLVKFHFFLQHLILISLTYCSFFLIPGILLLYIQQFPLFSFLFSFPINIFIHLSALLSSSSIIFTYSFFPTCVRLISSMFSLKIISLIFLPFLFLPLKIK